MRRHRALSALPPLPEAAALLGLPPPARGGSVRSASGKRRGGDDITPLAQRLIERAKIALAAHVHEDQGPNRGVWVHVYQAFAKIREGDPWCAAAACYWVWKAGQDLGIETKFPHTGSSSMIVRSARATGNLLPRPEPGCVGVRRGNAYGTGFEHTVVVTAVDADGQHFNTIEGNDGDAVRADRHAVSGWVFVRVY